MKTKDVVKQLVPGLVVGFILGFVLITVVGVDTKNEVPNIIGGVMSCAIPTLLNGLIVLKGTAKVLDRKLSIGKALIRNIPYIINLLKMMFHDFGQEQVLELEQYIKLVALVLV